MDLVDIVDDYIGSHAFYKSVLSIPHQPLSKADVRKKRTPCADRPETTVSNENLNDLLTCFHQLQLSKEDEQLANGEYYSNGYDTSEYSNLNELMFDYCQQFTDFPGRRADAQVTAPLPPYSGCLTIHNQLARICPDKYEMIDFTFGDFDSDPTCSTSEELDLDYFTEHFDSLITHSAIDSLLNGPDSRYYRGLDVTASGDPKIVADHRKYVGILRIFERLQSQLDTCSLVIVDVPDFTLEQVPYHTGVLDICFGSFDIETVDVDSGSISSYVVNPRKLSKPSQVRRIYSTSELIFITPPDGDVVRVVMTREEFLSFKTGSVIGGLTLQWLHFRTHFGRTWLDTG